MSERPREDKVARWYFGGLACAGAVCCTHPLELIKVFLQTQETAKLSIVKTTSKIIKQDGFSRLYNGISASILHELTYSTARFALYEKGKQMLPADAGFGPRILVAGMAGAIGGFIGVPPDVINVRMENDMKLPVDQRRNYKHVFDGLIRVTREEGFLKLFSGSLPTLGRAGLITIGQIAFYEQIKKMLLTSGHFKDDTKTHFISSLAAGGIATTLTQPLDVLKTRAMNAKPGEFKNFLDLIHHIAKLGPLAFYKGFTPAFIRLGPHTVITFLLLETMRLNFGYFPDE